MEVGCGTSFQLIVRGCTKPGMLLSGMPGMSQILLIDIWLKVSLVLYTLKWCWPVGTLALLNLCWAAPSTQWGCWPAWAPLTTGQWWGAPCLRLAGSVGWLGGTQWSWALEWSKRTWSTLQCHLMKLGEEGFWVNWWTISWRFLASTVKTFKRWFLTFAPPRPLGGGHFFLLGVQVFSPPHIIKYSSLYPCCTLLYCLVYVINLYIMLRGYS